MKDNIHYSFVDAIVQEFSLRLLCFLSFNKLCCCYKSCRCYCCSHHVAACFVIVLFGSLFSVFVFVFVLNKNVFIFVILNVWFVVCVSVVVGAAVLVGLVGFVIAYNHAIAIFVN